MPLCAVLTCQANSDDPTARARGVSFHHFPRNEEVMLKWIDMTGRDMLWRPRRDSVVCSRHFRDNDYFIKRSGNRYLKTAAIPCEYVVYRNLFPDEGEPLTSAAGAAAAAESNEAEVQVEPTPGPSRPRSPVPVPLSAPPAQESQVASADTTCDLDYDYNDNDIGDWDPFSPDVYFDACSSPMLDHPTSGMDSTGFGQRYHHEMESAINPRTPIHLSSQMHELASPRDPELPALMAPMALISPMIPINHGVLMDPPAPAAPPAPMAPTLVPETEPDPVASTSKGHGKGRKEPGRVLNERIQIDEIKKLLTKRKDCKKNKRRASRRRSRGTTSPPRPRTMAATLAEIREAQKIHLQLLSGTMTDFEKASAIIILQTKRIIKLTAKQRKHKRMLKKISTIVNEGAESTTSDN